MTEGLATLSEAHQQADPLHEQHRPFNPVEIAAQAQALQDSLHSLDHIILNGPDAGAAQHGLEPGPSPIAVINDETRAELDTGDNANMQDLYLGLRTRLAEKHPDLLSIVGPHIDQAVAIDGETRKLQAQYGEPMAAYRDESIVNLASQVNWDQIVRALVEDDWPPEASFSKELTLEKMRAVAMSRSSDDLLDMYTDGQNADQLLELARSIDCIFEEPASEPSQGWFADTDVVGFIETLEAAVHTDVSMIDHYMDPARGAHLKNLYRHVNFDPIKIVSASLQLTGLRDRHAITLLSPLVLACQRYASGILQGVYNSEKAFTQYHAERRPNALYIDTTRQALLRENTGISDVPTWVRQRLSRFGPLAAGIGFIEFSDGDQSDHHTEHTKIVTAGNHVPMDNKLVIDVRTGTKRTLDRRQPDNPTVARMQLREKIETTFDHEVGHHIHGAMLTVGELRRWHQALLAEPDPNINGYMSDLVQSREPKERIAKEQFAITTALYMKDPLRTALEYPARFEALNGIIRRYDDTLIQGLLESVRKTLLSGNRHEAYRQLEICAKLFSSLFDDRGPAAHR